MILYRTTLYLYRYNSSTHSFLILYTEWKNILKRIRWLFIILLQFLDRICFVHVSKVCFISFFVVRRFFQFFSWLTVADCRCFFITSIKGTLNMVQDTPLVNGITNSLILEHIILFSVKKLITFLRNNTIFIRWLFGFLRF
jgi:hypothetical protein